MPEWVVVVKDMNARMGGNAGDLNAKVSNKLIEGESSKGMEYQE